MSYLKPQPTTQMPCTQEMYVDTDTRHTVPHKLRTFILLFSLYCGFSLHINDSSTFVLPGG
jgi:hypothetical protein